MGIYVQGHKETFASVHISGGGEARVSGGASASGAEVGMATTAQPTTATELHWHPESQIPWTLLEGPLIVTAVCVLAWRQLRPAQPHPP